MRLPLRSPLTNYSPGSRHSGSSIRRTKERIHGGIREFLPSAIKSCSRERRAHSCTLNARICGAFTLPAGSCAQAHRQPKCPDRSNRSFNLANSKSREIHSNRSSIYSKRRGKECAGKYGMIPYLSREKKAPFSGSSKVVKVVELVRRARFAGQRDAPFAYLPLVLFLLLSVYLSPVHSVLPRFMIVYRRITAQGAAEKRNARKYVISLRGLAKGARRTDTLRVIVPASCRERDANCARTPGHGARAKKQRLWPCFRARDRLEVDPS